MSQHFDTVDSRDCLALEIDTHVEIGEEVVGPDAVFATALAEVMLTAKDLRRARALVEQVLSDPPRVAAVSAGG